MVSALIWGSWIGCVPEARPDREAVDGKNFTIILVHWYNEIKRYLDKQWEYRSVWLFIICSVDFYLLDCGCTSMCDRDY